VAEPLDPLIVRIHEVASRRGEHSYLDPRTGMVVMTAVYLQARGFCCGAGCRHCPYPPDEQARAGRPVDPSG
jgi:hypothetical protein